MKVLYFMNHVDYGGAALALYDLIFELKKNASDFIPIVITGRHNGLNKMFDSIGVENYSADFKNFLSTYKRPKVLTCPALLFRYEIGKKIGLSQIENLVDFSRIDIIHTNLDRIDIGAILAARHGLPHVWHIRENTIIEGLQADCSKTKGSSDFDLISVKHNPVKYMNELDNNIIRGNYFVAISNAVRNEWVKKGIPENKIHLVYDGVRTELYEKFSLFRSITIEKRIPMIFMGGYCKEKGQESLLEALKTLSEDERNCLHVDFYGGGDKRYLEQIKKKYVTLLKSEVVSFYDYDPEISKRLGNYIIGFNCSNAEGFGRVTVEYMMAGLCPIVSNTGANTEIVSDEKNGLIYEKNSILNLCDKLRFVICHIDQVKEFGVNAKRYAVERFSMKKHALEIMQLYCTLIGVKQ